MHIELGPSAAVGKCGEANLCGPLEPQVTLQRLEVRVPKVLDRPESPRVTHATFVGERGVANKEEAGRRSANGRKQVRDRSMETLDLDPWEPQMMCCNLDLFDELFVTERFLNDDRSGAQRWLDNLLAEKDTG